MSADAQHHAGDPRLLELSAPPMLAMLAALAAVADLLLNRIVPLAMNMLASEEAAGLLRFGPWPRNVAAVAGITALGMVLFGFLKMPGFSGLFRRLQIAALAGLLFPALLLGLVLPKERLPAPVVLVAVGVGHALVALFGVVVISYRASVARRPSIAASLTSALVLTLLVTASLETLQRFLETPESFAAKVVWGVMVGSRLLGECLWCTVPWLALLPWLRSLVRERRAQVALLVFGVVAVGASVAAETLLHPHYALVAYSGFRLTFISERYAGLYGLFALSALALALAAATSSRPVVRQHAVAVLLWIACGFAPRSLSQVLYFVLAAAIFARVTQATDPEGRRRALLPWGAPLHPPRVPDELR